MYHIIVNPASKSGRGHVIWDKIKKELDIRKEHYQVYFTKKSGDAQRLAEEITTCIKEDFVSMIVLGGDGTMNEIINGIRDFGRTHIGYIPTGSSNDLARDMGYSKNPIDALHTIIDNKEIRLMDLGMVTYELEGTEDVSNIVNGKREMTRFFGVSSGVGFDAAVCEETLHSGIKNFLNKIGLGKLTYLGVAVKQLMTGPSVACRITLDHKKEITLSKFLFIAPMIHKYEGGGFMFCPDANAEDGFLDICVVGELSRLRCFRILPTAFKGNHIKFNKIDNYRSRAITVEMDSPLWLHTDGEVPCETKKAVFTCLEHKLKFYV